MAVELFPDIYHAVRIGVWLDKDTNAPVYAVDIATHITGDEGPDSVVGSGATLQEALDNATTNLAVFKEEA